MKLYRNIIKIQGIYILITAVWALLDIESFMLVTGYKTDVWLVKTVSLLLMSVALTLLSFLFVPSHPWTAGILGGTSAAALMMIDFYYGLTGVISPVYMIDGVVEFGFVVIWIYMSVKK